MPSEEIYHDFSNQIFWEGFKKNTVVFTNMKNEYSSTEAISIRVCLPSKLKAKETDMVGLFPLGWSTLRQSLTFEWATDGKTNNSGLHDVTLQFAPQFHSHFIDENKHYQFVYISRQIEVLGVSSPFRFYINSTGRKDLEAFEILPVISNPNKPLSSRSYLCMDFTLSPTADKQSTMQLALERNRYLEEKVAQLEKELDHSNAERKKSEELVKFISTKKKMNQSFIQNLMTDLDRKETVKVVYGRTEMTIKKISKRERPKPENPCTRIVDKSSTPDLSSSQLDAVPSLMKELCTNLKKSLKGIGIPLDVTGTNLRSNSKTSDGSKKLSGDNKPVVKFYEEKDKSTTLIPREKRAESNHRSKPNTKEEENNFQEYLITKAHSFFPSVAFLEQKVLDMRQVLDIIVNHLNLTKNKWSVLWNESKTGYEHEVNDGIGKSPDKRVKIKLVIPMTQKDIFDMFGGRKKDSIEPGHNLEGDYPKEEVRERNNTKDNAAGKIMKQLQADGVKLSGRSLEID